MLSLPPRYDLFHFAFPKTIIPTQIEKKYYDYINRTKSVITSPIDLLNESIVGVNIPSLSELITQQSQIGYSSRPTNVRGRRVEPTAEVEFRNTDNILAHINREFKVTMRLNQGFVNYFMMYETIFYAYDKSTTTNPLDVFTVDVLNELGQIVCSVDIIDPHFDGIDGLEFSYNKLDQSTNTFDLTFKFTNINIRFFDEFDA